MACDVRVGMALVNLWVACGLDVFDEVDTVEHNLGFDEVFDSVEHLCVVCTVVALIDNVWIQLYSSM